MKYLYYFELKFWNKFMAGHSKWANTKHRKILQNVKKEKIFTKIIRELMVIVKNSGNNVSSNLKLRRVINKALSYNIPRDTLNSVISKIVCNNNNQKTNIVTYEGYGPGGTAIMVYCLTNNRNRSAAEVRYAFAKFDGKLSINDSVSYLFVKTGIILFSSEVNEDKIINISLKSGADNVIKNNDGTISVFTKPKILDLVKNSLKSSNLISKNFKITMLPLVFINLNKNDSIKLFNFIRILKNITDIQEVYHNGNFYNTNN